VQFIVCLKNVNRVFPLTDFTDFIYQQIIDFFLFFSLLWMLVAYSIRAEGIYAYMMPCILFEQSGGYEPQ